MAKFCTKCGRMLADGEVCNCGQASGGQNQYQNGYQNQMGGQNQYQNGYQNQMGGQNQYQNGYQNQMGGQNQYQNGYQNQMGGQNQYQNGYQGQQGAQYGPYGQMAGQYTGQAAMLAKGIWANIIDIVKKPVTTGKRLMQEANIKTAILLIVLHAIMNAVFIKLVENRIAEEIYKEYKANASFLSDNVKITMPYLRAFIVTILLTVCISCALAGLMLVCYRLSNIAVSYIQMLVLVSVRSAVLIQAVFISGIIFIISWNYGILAFMLVSIVGLICIVCTATAIAPDDKKDKLVLLMSIMVLIFLAVKIFIIYKMCPLYLPEDVKDSINSIKDLL